MRKATKTAYICIVFALFCFFTAESFGAISPIDIKYPPQNFISRQDTVILSASSPVFRDVDSLSINNRGCLMGAEGKIGGVFILKPGKSFAKISLLMKDGTTVEAYRKMLRVVEYSDMDDVYNGKSHWAKETIINMGTLGVIEAYPDGTFMPAKDVTKGEFATWLCNAVPLVTATVISDVFFDVPKDHWRASYIKAVVDAGLMQGKSSDEFGVDEAITREQAVISALKASGYYNNLLDSSVNLEKAVEIGLILGTSTRSKQLFLEKNMRRDEAACLISRLPSTSQKIAELADWDAGFIKENLCEVNFFPVITATIASPETIMAGSAQPLKIIVKAEDPDGKGDIISVKADLSAIGGPPDAILYDDATHGDVISGDSSYTLSIPINSDIRPGQKEFTVTVVDKAGSNYSVIVGTNVVPKNVPPQILSSIAYPPAVKAGRKTMLAVKVFDGDGLNNISSVAVDLSGIGGEKSLQLFDDGQNGDVTAADGIYMMDLKVPDGARSGDIVLPVTVIDKAGSKVMGEIGITIL